MPESMTSSETSNGLNGDQNLPTGTNGAPPEKGKLQTLADIFNEEPEQGSQGEADESQSSAEPTGGKPKGLKDVAEKLQLKPEDLYAVEVPMSDGKSMTLGALKDAAAKQGDFTVRELELEERRAKQEAEHTRAQTELAGILGMLPENAVKPEVREVLRRKAVAQVQAEGALIRQHIPEWADEKTRDTELAGMVEMLADYGFPKTYLQDSISHRMVRFARDAYLRKQRIDKALAQVEAVKKPSATGKSKPSGTAKREAPQAPRRQETSRDRLLSLMQ